MAETKKAAKKDDKASAKPELKAVEKDNVLPPVEEGVEGGGAAGDDASPGFSKKKLIIIVLLPVLILVGATAAYFAGYLGKFGAAKKVDCATVNEGDKDYAECAKELAQQSATLPPGVFVDVPDMIVNLSGNTKKTAYLKISLKVELESKDDMKNFTAIMPRVVDQFQTYLRELRLEDLKGSSGMYRMKIELLSRVRAAAPDIKVRDVLFQEILVQQ